MLRQAAMQAAEEVPAGTAVGIVGVKGREVSGTGHGGVHSSRAALLR